MKNFDIVLGSPGSNYETILKECLSWVKQNGSLLYIFPAIWRLRDNLLKEYQVDFLLKEYQIDFLKTHILYDSFHSETIGVVFDWFLLTKEERKNPTKLIDQFNKKHFINIDYPVLNFGFKLFDDFKNTTGGYLDITINNDSGHKVVLPSDLKKDCFYTTSPTKDYYIKVDSVDEGHILERNLNSKLMKTFEKMFLVFEGLRNYTMYDYTPSILKNESVELFGFEDESTIINNQLLVEILKLPKNRFETPSQLVHNMLDTLPKNLWDEDITFCEPSAGVGPFIKEVYRRKVEVYNHNPLTALGNVYAIEIDEGSYSVLYGDIFNMAQKYGLEDGDIKECMNNNIILGDMIGYKW